MDCLFCKEKARCRTELKFDSTLEIPSESDTYFTIIEFFCGGCQTFLKIRVTDKDVRDVLEKVPKLFDCATNFDKGLLS